MSSLGNSLEDANTSLSAAGIPSAALYKYKRDVSYSDVSKFVIIQFIIFSCLVVGIFVFITLRQRARARDRRDTEHQQEQQQRQYWATNIDTQTYLPARTNSARRREEEEEQEALKTTAVAGANAAYRRASTTSLRSPGFYGSLKLRNMYDQEDNNIRDSAPRGLKPPPKKRAILETDTEHRAAAAASSPTQQDHDQQDLDSSSQPQAAPSWPATPMATTHHPSSSILAPQTPIKTTYITLPSPSYLGNHHSSPNNNNNNNNPIHTPSFRQQPPRPAPPPSSTSAALLVPRWYQDAPPWSARSTRSNMTSDTRLSIRASSTESMMFMSALRPAPPPRRLKTVPSGEVD